MSSCSSQDPAEEDLGTGKEVTFVVSEQSRASVTSNINYAGSKFAIYGDMQHKDIPKTVTFDNTIVTYSDNKWVYTGTQYWFPRYEHSFIAQHPADAAGISDKEYSDSRLSFNYTLPDDYKAAGDLAVATHRRFVDPKVEAAPIALTFCHIMSRVNIEFTNEGAADLVTVNEIKLEGVNKTGSFTIIPAPYSEESKQTDDYDYSWSGISNPGTITASNINIEVPKDETRILFPNDNALFMVPQPDNKDVTIKITYTLSNANDEDKEATLTTQPVGGWEPGKRYKYIVSVKKHTITFEVIVEEWKDGTEDDLLVPRK